TAIILAAAIALDWCIGDPKWITHPVIWIGRFITRCTRWLRTDEANKRSLSPRQLKLRGVVLTISTVLLSFAAIWGIWVAAVAIHPWLGYAVNIWFISTTIAIKGLRDAALQVFKPLEAGNLQEARLYTGYI